MPKMEDNYTDLYAYVYTQREFYGDKLNILKTEAKSLYVPNNRERAISLRAEIFAVENYLGELDKYIKELIPRYKEIAVSFSNEDMEIFMELFLERKTPKEVSINHNICEGSIRNKKSDWAKKVRSKIRISHTMPQYAVDKNKIVKD